MSHNSLMLRVNYERNHHEIKIRIKKHIFFFYKYIYVYATPHIYSRIVTCIKKFELWTSYFKLFICSGEGMVLWFGILILYIT